MSSLLLLAVLAAQTATPFEWKEAMPKGSTIEVRGVIGGIRGVAARGNEVEVVGTRVRGRRGDPAAVEIRVIREVSRIIICTIYPQDDRSDRRRPEEKNPDSCEQAQQDAPRVRGGNDTRIDFEVRVPEGVNLVAQTVTEGVTLSGIRANAEGYSVAGDVRLSDIRGTAVDAASISGDITFDRVDASQLYAGTLSGDVLFQGTVRREGDYSLLSYTGELKVNLPSQAGVTLNVISPSDGLHSSVALTPRTGHTRRRFSGRQGNGSAHMSLTTLNGEVTIREAD
jgi:hypothetical protein